MDIYDDFTYFYNNIILYLGTVIVHIHLNINKTLQCRLYLPHVVLLLLVTVGVCLMSSTYYQSRNFNLFMDILSFVTGGFLVLYSKGTDWLGSLCLNDECSLQQNPFALLCFVLGDLMVFGSLYRVCLYMWNTENRIRNVSIVVIVFITIACLFSFVLVDQFK